MSKIIVSGSVTLSTRFEVELNMTEEQFDALSTRQQNELIDGHIDWHDAMRNAYVDEIDVWDLGEVGEESE